MTATTPPQEDPDYPPAVSNLPAWQDPQPGLAGQVGDFVFGFCLGLGLLYLVSVAIRLGGEG